MILELLGAISFLGLLMILGILSAIIIWIGDKQ